jgi:hypothetical protein
LPRAHALARERGADVRGSPATTAGSPATTTGAAAKKAPLRAAFYYPWFPQAWFQNGVYPFTYYHPSLGFYDSSNRNVIKRHVAAMQYAHLDAGIASWWGPDTDTDKTIPLLLAETMGTGFRWALYYEQEAYQNPSPEQIESDLTYIVRRYAANPGYLRLAGRPVVFVYSARSDRCPMTERWRTGNKNTRVFLVLKVFPGFTQCAWQPDGWHEYAAGAPEDESEEKGYYFSISPGYWLMGDDHPRLDRDLARWTQNVREMVESDEPLQLVATFNEWGEGTSVESAREWTSRSGYGSYLDVMHTLIPRRAGVPIGRGDHPR